MAGPTLQVQFFLYMLSFLGDLIDNKEFVIVGINISQKPYLCVNSEISQHLSSKIQYLIGNRSSSSYMYSNKTQCNTMWAQDNPYICIKNICHKFYGACLY
jgi:hypothetical protein